MNLNPQTSAAAATAVPRNSLLTRRRFSLSSDMGTAAVDQQQHIGELPSKEMRTHHSSSHSSSKSPLKKKFSFMRDSKRFLLLDDDADGRIGEIDKPPLLSNHRRSSLSGSLLKKSSSVLSSSAFTADEVQWDACPSSNQDPKQVKSGSDHAVIRRRYSSFSSCSTFGEPKASSNRRGGRRQDLVKPPQPPRQLSVSNAADSQQQRHRTPELQQQQPYPSQFSTLSSDSSSKPLSLLAPRIELHQQRPYARQLSALSSDSSCGVGARRRTKEEQRQQMHPYSRQFSHQSSRSSSESSCDSESSDTSDFDDQDVSQSLQGSESIYDSLLSEDDTGTVSTSSHAGCHADGVLYECARQCSWDRVAMICRANPRAAKHVGAEFGLTALHLAVLSRAPTHHASLPAPLAVIEQLIQACPEAAIVRCTAKRYTPLVYASLVDNAEHDLESAALMAQIILRYAPHSAMVFTDQGYSALDVHILTYSRVHQASDAGGSTAVLRALVNDCPTLVETRPYGQRVRGPLELLYRCNLQEFKQAAGGMRQLQKLAFHHQQSSSPSVSSSCCSENWWAWKWALIMLQVSAESSSSFSAVAAAAKLVGCPTPILALALDAFSGQAHECSKNHSFPLHEVCSWVADDILIEGDQVVLKRKASAISMLLVAFPDAAALPNGAAETPLQLAVETCTPWDKGLQALVKIFPEGLTVPRLLTRCLDTSPLSKALSLQDDDLGSLSCNEEEWANDALSQVEGMYPFLIASALSHVPERRQQSSTLLCDDKTNLEQQLSSKDLESLRSIFELLRAEPKALSMFRDDEMHRRKVEAFHTADQSQTSTEDEGSECSSSKYSSTESGLSYFMTEEVSEEDTEEEIWTQDTEEDAETLYSEFWE